MALLVEAPTSGARSHQPYPAMSDRQWRETHGGRQAGASRWGCNSPYNQVQPCKTAHLTVSHPNKANVSLYVLKTGVQYASGLEGCATTLGYPRQGP